MFGFYIKNHTKVVAGWHRRDDGESEKAIRDFSVEAGWHRRDDSESKGPQKASKPAKNGTKEKMESPEQASKQICFGQTLTYCLVNAFIII